MALRFEHRPHGVLGQLSSDLAALIEGALPAVVTIKGVTADLGDVTGSGFAVDHYGHVVTNHHVIDGLGSRLSAVLHGGTEVEVTIIGSDAVTDLAVLRLPAPTSTWLAARATPARLGELCVAVGSPLGEFAESVSLGVVSGLSRSLPAYSGQWTMEHMVQTDAAINPGNSGGPLLDVVGQVIGVNESGRTDGQNIGFAVPAATLTSVTTELIQHGDVKRAALGIVVATRSVADLVPPSRRLVVTDVKDPRGPIRVGDVMVSIGGRIVQDRGDLFSSLVRDLIGVPTTVDLIRNGKPLSVEVIPSAV